MLRAVIDLELECDCVLSRLAGAEEATFTATYEEVVDDEHVRFLLAAGDYAREFERRLSADDAIKAVEPVGEDQLLVTKRSCGAIPAIRRNHGILQGMDRVHGTRRTFEVVVFTRSDLRAIVGELQELGSVSLKQLKPAASPTSTLSARQAEVIRAAIEAGYFEWPRRTDAQTLASSLGISHSTFLEHLRKAEGKLLTSTFADADTPELTSP